MSTEPRYIDRSLLDTGVEAEYGVLAESFSPFPLLSDPASIVDEMNFYEKGVAASHGGSGVPRAYRTVTQVPDLTTELTGERGVWMDALAAGGFRFRDDLSSTSRDVWRIDRDADASLSVRVNVSGLRRKFVGCRGNAELSAEAGKPVQLRTVLSGLPIDEWEEVAIVPDLSVLDQPMLLCDAGFVIEPEGMATISPVLLSFKVGVNRILQERRTFNQDGGVRELRPVGRAPTWQCTIEQNGVDWGALAEAGVRCALSMEVSLGARALGLNTPHDRTAFLASPPVPTNEGGVLGVALVFGLSGQADGDLEVVRTGPS